VVRDDNVNRKTKASEKPDDNVKTKSEMNEEIRPPEGGRYKIKSRCKVGS